MELEFNEIISGRLWVGSYVREEDIPRLKHMGITAVVSLQTDEDMVGFSGARSTIDGGAVSLKFPRFDGGNQAEVQPTTSGYAGFAGTPE